MTDFDFGKCRRVAIMGGAFDPLHYGHLVTAQTVYDSFDVDKVVIMPLGEAPHKNMSSATAEERYEMIKAAVADNPAFAVSSMEIERKGKTYTVDTLSEIKKNNPNTEIYFVMGADEITSVERWKQPEKLLKMCDFIAVTRPGFDNEKVKNKIDSIRKKYGCNIFFLEVPSLDISSTELREKIRSGKNVKYLIPKETEKYIADHDLYKEGKNNA